MSRERQQKQSEEVRGRILETAKRIISEEGIDALSVRRITREMEYSTGIVYHYFDNKEQILACVLQEGYQRILLSIKPPNQNLAPDEALLVSLRRFIENMLKEPEIYRETMLNSSPQVLEFTSVLGEGRVEISPALMSLVSALEVGVSEKVFAPCNVQITAQAIWSSIFGLLMRLIIERDVSKEQQSKLIDCQIELILKGLRI